MLRATCKASCRSQRRGSNRASPVRSSRNASTILTARGNAVGAWRVQKLAPLQLAPVAWVTHCGGNIRLARCGSLDQRAVDRKVKRPLGQALLCDARLIGDVPDEFIEDAEVLVLVVSGGQLAGRLTRLAKCILRLGQL